MAPVVSQLAHSLRSRRISAGLITTLLGDVIEAIDMTNGGTEAFKIRISHILQTYLEHDVNSPQQFSEGLKQSRRRFITLAAFAKRTRSRVLASALASFFIQRGDDIIDRERSRLFTLWAIAIWDIRSLISPNDAVVCFQYLCARLDNIHDAFYTQRYRDKRLGHLIKALEPMAPRHEGCDICCNDMRIGMGMDECICHCHGGPFTPYMVPPTQYQGFPALGGAPMDEVDVLQQKLMHLDERVSHLEEHAHPYPHMLGYY
ncbi:hypothetical protein GQ43DRAFT_438270 [Delitschia confertaspora ATCC 74209]|uniref:Uncharacterized protein n=1 Tax=Delitschia confertaspora ATCC 74209 TaxID=1513339 RepID=A0A9P4MVF7_9PLEO|nr:hypothetical protein GQ43DRAFT_438270 [Delitschia confertaspora ATCC 74209]